MNPRPNRSGGILVAVFGLLAVLSSGQFPPFSNPNELSRLETVYAAVEHGTFAIDRAIPVLGDHEDKAVWRGHFYSNKAPGLALAALPVYRFLRIFFPRPQAGAQTIFILLRILVVSTLCTLAVGRFAARLGAEWNGRGPIVVAAAAFGTPYLTYSRTFLSHSWTAALVFLSWDLLRLARDREAQRRVDSLVVAAGFLAGWAAISEYPVALLTLLLAVLSAEGCSLRRLSFFALGVAFPMALLFFYDAVCFGSPFVISSSREALPQYAALAGRGLFGFTWPRPIVALAYLIHPARGLLLFCPFLMWSAAGLLLWWRRGDNRRDSGFALGATLLFFVALCGYPNWHGGWALGDRYLLPVLFLASMAIPHAMSSPASRALFAAAAVFSVAVHALASATWPHFPLNVPWPPANGSAWFLARGWIAPGPLPDGIRLVLLLAAPLAALVAALSVVPLARGRWIPLIGGLVLCAGTLIWRPELSYGGRLWRAAVFGRFSGLDPDRRELRRVMAEASSASEIRRAADAWRLYGRGKAE